jgi:hypothetical protein
LAALQVENAATQCLSSVKVSERLYVYKLERDRERDSEFVDPKLNPYPADDTSSFASRPGVVTMSFDRALKLSQVCPCPKELAVLRIND